MSKTINVPHEKNFTPREIVGELDKFIVGQNDAKRAVAIALRNRWRRRRVEEPMRDEITPKNIILVGPTGVGKTEIARRLAKLAQAPFVKVEASKFTEVGYVGRDVDSMIRDLVENAIRMVRAEARERVFEQAKHNAEERVLDVLLPTSSAPSYETSSNTDVDQGDNETREKLRTLLRDGKMDEREIEIDSEERKTPMMQVFSSPGVEEMGINLQDMMGQMMGGRRTRKRRVNVPEALETFAEEEAQKLIDHDSVQKEAVMRAEQSGIVFLDEIDKIGKQGSGQGPDVSREGVQRDILPIIEGSTVNTKYGPVHTDHMLFVAAGAFHVTKVSDLIPELQGRFPIRVELQTLTKEDFVRILKEPQNALPAQYTALLNAENVTLAFSDDAIDAIAEFATEANAQAENIGARRLHTILERLLDDISFHAPEKSGETLTIDRGYVRDRLVSGHNAEDLQRYIL